VDPTTRVCPFCGDPPGDGVFCASCGRNLAAIERLPTAADWQAGGASAEEATAAFIAAMRAAGNPGAAEFPAGKPSAFRRAPRLRGWVVRPVEREDFEQPRRYEPGLLLTVEGRFHRLDSELRGWGQRDFPHYHHTVSLEPVAPPAAAELVELLAAARRAAVG
jgi:hypothetical protein